MKRKFLIVSLVIASLLATYAISQTVTGENWVGYVRIPAPPPGELKMIGVNFEAVGSEGGGIPLNELLNTNNLVGGGPPQTRDRVYIWNIEEQKYGIYSYNDGNFYDGPIMTNPVVYAGEAMWLRSASGAAETRELYALGQVNLSSNVQVAYTEGLQLSCYPYPSDMVFSNLDWSVASAEGPPQKRDRVYVWTGNNYQIYTLGVEDSDYVWKDGGGNSDLVIAPGSAFWYRAVNTYTNYYDRPFDIN